MSIFRYIFDNDFRQRRDIEDLRENLAMVAATNTGPSDQWIRQISDDVKELSATIHVLMRTLAEHRLLDVAKIEAEVTEELKPKKQARIEGPVIDTTCVRCNAAGKSNEMVRVGADWFCRPCARNP